MAGSQKVFLRIVGLIGDSGDPDEMPDRVNVTGRGRLIPTIAAGAGDVAQGPDSLHEIRLIEPVDFEIIDGMLTYDAKPYVWLPVPTGEWMWRITFDQVRVGEQLRELRDFLFPLDAATPAQIADEGYPGINLAQYGIGAWEPGTVNLTAEAISQITIYLGRASNAAGDAEQALEDTVEAGVVAVGNIEAAGEAAEARIDVEHEHVHQDVQHVDQVAAQVAAALNQANVFAQDQVPPYLQDAALKSTYRPIFGVSADYVNDASLDATAHVQARMDQANAAGGGEVYVPGVLRIDGTLIIPARVTLRLEQGAQLVRYSAHSSSTDPIVVLGTNYARLVGGSMKSSMVVSQNPTPEGVVILGHSEFRSVVSVQHSSIVDIGIRGHTSGGNTEGVPTVALAITSRQEEGPTFNNIVYFNYVDNVACEYANVGMLLEGWVNANFIDNIFMYGAGNGERLGGAGIVFRAYNGNSPLDLMIGTMFHHGSGGSATLRFEAKVIYSDIGPIVSEPGGTSRFARLVGNSEESTALRINGVANNYGGVGLTDAFYENNKVSINGWERVHSLGVFGDATVGGNLAVSGTLASGEVEASGGSIADTAYGSRYSTQVPENTNCGIAEVTIGGATHYHCLIEMDVEISFFAAQTRFVRAKFLARSTPTGVTVTPLPSPASASFALVPVVSGQTVTLGVKTPNAGTGATASVTARVRAHHRRASINMLDAASEAIASTALLPAAVGGLGGVTSGAPQAATKKVELFDASGVSLGFIAVSDS